VGCRRYIIKYEKQKIKTNNLFRFGSKVINYTFVPNFSPLSTGRRRRSRRRCRSLLSRVAGFSRILRVGYRRWGWPSPVAKSRLYIHNIKDIVFILSATSTHTRATPTAAVLLKNHHQMATVAVAVATMSAEVFD